MVHRNATNRVLAAFTYNNVIMCLWKTYVQYIPCKDTLMLVAGIMDKHVCQCSLRWKPSTNQIAGRNPGWTKFWGWLWKIWWMRMGLAKWSVEKSHIDGDEDDEENFECFIERGEDEEDNGGDDKKLRSGAASQGFLYFCLQLILCAKLSPEL